jgi:hypothetical protein
MMFIMGKVPVFGTSTHTLDISQLGYVLSYKFKLNLGLNLILNLENVTFF